MNLHKGFEYEIDLPNGEAKIYNADGKHVDTVDLWDLLVEYDRKSDERIKECIEQNSIGYKNFGGVENS